MSAPRAASRSSVTAESRSRSHVPRQRPGHPPDLRAPHAEAVVVELLAEPDRVGAVGVERQVDHRALRAQQPQRQRQRRGPAATLEHDVGAVVAGPVAPAGA